LTIRSRQLLDILTCGSWLVYATRSEAPDAGRIRNIVLFIKRDQLQPETGRPYADVVIERMASTLGPSLGDLFGNGAFLIPVPGAGLTRPRTVWPALSICNGLLRCGLGASVGPVLRRARAVPKSAGSQTRPSLREHYDSLTVQGTLSRPHRIVLVDDVVTSGTTLMAGARRLSEVYPKAAVTAFALARVHSAGEPRRLFEPMIERIIIAGARCRRESQR
jgi:phosphoribosylpyrophosphate synthetase